MICPKFVSGQIKEISYVIVTAFDVQKDRFFLCDSVSFDQLLQLASFCAGKIRRLYEKIQSFSDQPY